MAEYLNCVMAQLIKTFIHTRQGYLKYKINKLNFKDSMIIS